MPREQAHQGHLPAVGVDTTPTRLRRDTARETHVLKSSGFFLQRQVMRLTAAVTTPCGGRREAGQGPRGTGASGEGTEVRVSTLAGQALGRGGNSGCQKQQLDFFLRGGVSDGCWGHWTGPLSGQVGVRDTGRASGIRGVPREGWVLGAGALPCAGR